MNEHNFKINIESIIFNQAENGQYCIYVGAHFGKFFIWTVSSKTAETISIVEDSVGDRAIKFFRFSVSGKNAVFRGTPEPQMTY